MRSLPQTLQELWRALPPGSLTSIDRSHLERLLSAREALAAARSMAAVEAGNSWAVIGAVLGISRQAAHERFGKRVSAVRMAVDPGPARH